MSHVEPLGIKHKITHLVKMGSLGTNSIFGRAPIGFDGCSPFRLGYSQIRGQCDYRQWIVGPCDYPYLIFEKFLYSIQRL